jgi:hypothetical protein
MNNQELIALIEAEWDLDNGFFGALRQGQFDQSRYSRCMRALEHVHHQVRNAEDISRRLVSLVWYIPQFMNWQTERVKGSVAAQVYQRVTNEFQTIVQEILGVP